MLKPNGLLVPETRKRSTASRHCFSIFKDKARIYARIPVRPPSRSGETARSRGRTAVDPSTLPPLSRASPLIPGGIDSRVLLDRSRRRGVRRPEAQAHLYPRSNGRLPRRRGAGESAGGGHGPAGPAARLIAAFKLARSRCNGGAKGHPDRRRKSLACDPDGDAADKPRRWKDRC